MNPKISRWRAALQRRLRSPSRRWESNKLVAKCRITTNPFQTLVRSATEVLRSYDLNEDDICRIFAEGTCKSAYDPLATSNFRCNVVVRDTVADEQGTVDEAIDLSKVASAASENSECEYDDDEVFARPQKKTTTSTRTTRKTASKPSTPAKQKAAKTSPDTPGANPLFPELGRYGTPSPSARSKLPSITEKSDEEDDVEWVHSSNPLKRTRGTCHSHLI